MLKICYSGQSSGGYAFTNMGGLYPPPPFQNTRTHIRIHGGGPVRITRRENFDNIHMIIF